MRYLLDTHTILWYLFGDSLADFDKVRQLPIQENVKHNDPFDRILISQAINNDMTIITCNEKIPLYKVKTTW